MKPALRVVAAAILVLILAWVGWTSVQATRADALANTDPEAALRLDPDHPQALLRMAWRQLGNNQDDAATATARHLLSVEPGQGDAFAVLALAAARRGDPDAGQLAKIALQRAPRNRDLRTQVAAAALKAGDLPAAMAQLDALLRLSPSRGDVLFPAMAQQAAAPGFAKVLAASLATSPPWRTRFLLTLNAKGSQAAVDQVYSALRDRGELSDRETGRWLDRMIDDGRWGEAYAHWFGTLDVVADTLKPVRDGGFEQDADGIGFEWRNDRVKGAFATFEPTSGASGTRAAHIHFIGRPAARGNLRQALLLAPGHYRLSMRVRMEFLHSDQGLQWRIRCDGGPVAATLGPLDGNVPWQSVVVDFGIPAARCAGQWLELVNPAVKGVAQQVSGDLWIDDVAITPLPAALPL
jgi:tetratricopeptide (TPR) repeat protein